VVDLQREPELLGEGDVVAERRALDLPGPFPAAEEVEAGLPDRPDPLVARELRDPGDGVVQGRLVTRGDGGVEPVRRDLPDARVERRLVRVDGEGRDHLRVLLGERDAALEGVEVAAHLDHAVHARSGGPVEVLGDAERLGALTHPRVLLRTDGEVGVVVDDGGGQRLGGRRPAALAGAHRAVPSPSSSASGVTPRRASSSATIASSSLVKTGAGFATGAPTRTGRGPHTGTPV